MKAVKKWALPVLLGSAVPVLFLYAINDKAMGILNPQIPVKAQKIPLEAPRATPIKVDRWVNPEPEQLTNPWPAEITTQPAPPKQTVFTDRNYNPKQAANVVSRTRDTGPSRQPQREGAVVTGIKEPKRISDNCDAWKKGSVERRECRMRTELEYRN